MSAVESLGGERIADEAFDEQTKTYRRAELGTGSATEAWRLAGRDSVGRDAHERAALTGSGEHPRVTLGVESAGPPAERLSGPRQERALLEAVHPFGEIRAWGVRRNAATVVVAQLGAEWPSWLGRELAGEYDALVVAHHVNESVNQLLFRVEARVKRFGRSVHQFIWLLAGSTAERAETQQHVRQFARSLGIEGGVLFIYGSTVVGSGTKHALGTVRAALSAGVSLSETA